MNFVSEDISNFKFQISNISARAVFFDRDGVLNIDYGYVYKIEDWQWTPNAVEVIRWCNENGWLAIVVTNQSGVARGYYSEEDVLKLHSWLNEQLAQQNARIDAFYHCPHYPQAAVEKYAQDCDCRKPRPGMLLQAVADYGIEPAASVMFGDKDADVQAANAAGVRGIKVEKNRGWQTVAEFTAQINDKG